ncbi:MAG TPA: aminotransferase class I/II-fold pyridoxal phosphate-dependent enzyme, partial [Gammaproteobacteria bacterium]
PFNVNLIAQVAALAALEDQAHIANSFELNRKGLAQLEQGFKQMGLSFIPSIGNFISVDMNRVAAPLYDALLHEGVIVRPVASYNMPNHLRITVGTTEQNQRFLTALQKVMQ